MSYKPTKAQMHVLRNLEAGRKPTHGLHSNSQWGGFSATWPALVKKGLVACVDGEDVITDAGRAALTEHGSDA